MGNGQVAMSNIFLSTAILTLAQIEISCQDEGVECGKVHGYKPSSLITMIGTVSGILSALLLPFMGAIIDCTDHRRNIGIVSCFCLMLIQTIQIGTVENTWWAMAILQAINGFVYQVVILAAFSYLPEIGRDVGEETLTEYSADWSILAYAAQIMYMVVVIGSSICLGLNDVQTGQLGQAVNIPASGICYYYACKFFSKKAARRKLSSKESLFGTGCRQVFRTASGISRHYGPSLGWFLLAVTFSEAAANAFILVAVTYLKEVMGFGSSEIGILFFIVIIAFIPGSYLGKWLTVVTACPKTTMKLQLVTFILVNFAGFSFLTKPERANLAYLFGALWGVLLGWFYPTEALIFSMIVPQGQESELAGFFLYCSQILGWLPPLVFTLMNEKGIALKYGGAHLNIYLFVALMCYHFMLPWDQCLEAVQWNKMMDESEVPIIANTRDGVENIELGELSSKTEVKTIFKRGLD
jgi:MFS-type transporter involved in bile tolerance (Atg22 family)